MRTCSTELAKHMLPVLTNPRGRIFIGALLAVATEGADEDDGGVRSAMSSAFLEGVMGKPSVSLVSEAEVGVAGMENPTTDDVGKPFLEDEEPAVDEDPAGRRREAHDFLTGAGAGGGGVGDETGPAAAGSKDGMDSAWGAGSAEASAVVEVSAA